MPAPSLASIPSRLVDHLLHLTTDLRRVRGGRVREGRVREVGIPPPILSSIMLILVLLGGGASLPLAAVDTSSEAQEPNNWAADFAPKDYQTGTYFQKRFLRNGQYKEAQDNAYYALWREPGAYPDIGTVVWRRKLEWQQDRLFFLRWGLKNARAKLLLNHNVVENSENTDQKNTVEFRRLFATTGYGELASASLDLGVMFGPGSYAGAQCTIDGSDSIPVPQSDILPWCHDEGQSQSDYGQIVEGDYTQRTDVINTDWRILEESKLIFGTSTTKDIIRGPTVEFHRSLGNNNWLTGCVAWRTTFINKGSYQFTVTLNNARGLLRVQRWKGNELRGQWVESWDNRGQNDNTYVSNNYPVGTEESLKVACIVNFNGRWWNAMGRLNHTFIPKDTTSQGVEPDWFNGRNDGDFGSGTFMRTHYFRDGTWSHTLRNAPFDLFRNNAQWQDIGAAVWRKKIRWPQDGAYTIKWELQNARAKLWFNNQEQPPVTNNSGTGWTRHASPTTYLGRRDSWANIDLGVVFGPGVDAGAKVMANDSDGINFVPVPDSVSPSWASNHDGGDFIIGNFTQKVNAIRNDNPTFAPNQRSLRSEAVVEYRRIMEDSNTVNTGCVAWTRTLTESRAGTYRFTVTLKNARVRFQAQVGSSPERYEENRGDGEVPYTFEYQARAVEPVRMSCVVNFFGERWDAMGRFQYQFIPSNEPPPRDTTMKAIEPMNPPWHGQYADGDYNPDIFFQKLFYRDGTLARPVPNASYAFHRTPQNQVEIGSVLWRKQLRWDRDGTMRIRVGLKNAEGRMYINHQPWPNFGFLVGSDPGSFTPYEANIRNYGGRTVTLDWIAMLGADSYAASYLDVVNGRDFTAVPDSASPFWTHVDQTEDFTSDDFIQRTTDIDGSNGKREQRGNAERVELSRTLNDNASTGCVAWRRAFIAPQNGTYRFTVTMANARATLRVGPQPLEYSWDKRGEGQRAETVEFQAKTGERVKLSCIVNFLGERWNASGQLQWQFTPSPGLPLRDTSRDAVEPHQWFVTQNPSEYQVGRLSQTLYYRDGNRASINPSASATFERTGMPEIGTSVWRTRLKYAVDGTYTLGWTLKNARSTLLDPNNSLVQFNNLDAGAALSIRRTLPGKAGMDPAFDLGVFFGPGAAGYANLDAFGMDGAGFDPVPDSVDGSWAHRDESGDFPVDAYRQKLNAAQDEAQPGLRSTLMVVGDEAVYERIMPPPDRSPIGCVAWRRTFTAPRSGQYTFTVQLTNARCIMRVNGREASQRNSGTTPASFTFGPYRVAAGETLNLACIVNFYGTYWHARGQLRHVFTADTIAPPPPPPVNPPPPAAVDPGFAWNVPGEYPVNAAQLTTWTPSGHPLAQSTIPTMTDLALTRSTNANTKVGVMRWRMSLQPDEFGVYTFTLRGDMGKAWLRLDGEPALEIKNDESTTFAIMDPDSALEVDCVGWFDQGWDASAGLTVEFNEIKLEKLALDDDPYLFDQDPRMMATVAGQQNNLIPGAVYAIQAVCSGLFLDVPGAVTTPGTPLIQWGINNGAQHGANQQWLLEQVSEQGFRITSMVSGLALDTDKSQGVVRDGDPAVQSRPSVSDLWRLELNPDGTYGLTSQSSGKYLEVQNGSPQPGAVIRQFGRSGAEAQRWRLIPLTSIIPGAVAADAGMWRSAGSSYPDPVLKKKTSREWKDLETNFRRNPLMFASNPGSPDYIPKKLGEKASEHLSGKVFSSEERPHVRPSQRANPLASRKLLNDPQNIPDVSAEQFNYPDVYKMYKFKIEWDYLNSNFLRGKKWQFQKKFNPITMVDVGVTDVKGNGAVDLGWYRSSQVFHGPHAILATIQAKLKCGVKAEWGPKLPDLRVMSYPTGIFPEGEWIEWSIGGKGIVKGEFVVEPDVSIQFKAARSTAGRWGYGVRCGLGVLGQVSVGGVLEMSLKKARKNAASAADFNGRNNLRLVSENNILHFSAGVMGKCECNLGRLTFGIMWRGNPGEKNKSWGTDWSATSVALIGGFEVSIDLWSGWKFKYEYKCKFYQPEGSRSTAQGDGFSDPIN